MKIVEIDIDRTSSLEELEYEFKNLERGDRLQLVFSRQNENQLIVLSVVIVIYYFLNKKFDEYPDKMLKGIFRDRKVEEIERELKADFDIELVIDSKEDGERRQWQQFSQSSLVKAYGFEEPEYDEYLVKEPNPEYNKSETRRLVYR